jgi:hypothetical protein
VHAEGGALQEVLAALLGEYAQSPAAMGLLAARLCSLWLAFPAAALHYVSVWERLLMYGGSSDCEPALPEARPFPAACPACWKACLQCVRSSRPLACVS